MRGFPWWGGVRKNERMLERGPETDADTGRTYVG